MHFSKHRPTFATGEPVTATRGAIVRRLSTLESDTECNTVAAASGFHRGCRGAPSAHPRSSAPVPHPSPARAPASNATWRPIIAAALLPLLAACGGSDAAATGATIVQDSAGVKIVESVAPAWEEGDAWQLSATPLLEIGATDGPPEYLFNRIVGAVRFEDGSIVVANAGSQQIRFYDASGAHQRTVGRSGSGPEEFQSMGWMDRFRGDSLVIYDPQSARATVISRTGEFTRTISLERHSSGGLPSLVGAAGDGTFIARVNAVLAEDDLASGMLSTPATYYRLSSADGALQDSIITLPGRESHLQIGEGSITVMQPLIGPAPHVAATGDAVYIGFGGVFEIRRYNSDGVLQNLIRRGGEPKPLSATDLASLRDKRLEGMEPEGMERMGQVLESMPTPLVRPAFASLLADQSGNLWVEESNLPGEPNRWAVFEAEGRLLGSIDLPDGFRPFQAVDDYILGVATDDFGIERVHVYGVEKP